MQLMAMVAGGAALVMVGLALTFLVGMRTKNRRVQGAVIRFTRDVMNPRMLGTAGAPGAYAAIVRVRGRTSGRLIDTPIGAVRHEDGFLVSLPYGTRPQWLRNLFAAGEGTLVHEGSTWAISGPEVLPLEPVAGVFSPSDQRMHSLFGVTHVLRVRADPIGERVLTPAA